jgi:hypothetical protein
MIDDRKRRSEWAALLDAWPAPAPPRGFADRVLAACTTPPPFKLSIVREPPPRARRSGIYLAAALAAAALIFVPLALRHHGSSTPSAPAMVTASDSADLGSIHD